MYVQYFYGRMGQFMKKTAILCTLLLAILLLAGCVEGAEPPSPTQAPADTAPSTETPDDASPQDPVLDGIAIPDENYFDFVCENCDISQYSNLWTSNAITFYLFSGRALDPLELTLCSDIGEPFQIDVFKQTVDGTVSFSKLAFYAYQCGSWVDIPTNEETLARYDAAYALLADTLPRLYIYQINPFREELGVSYEQMIAQKIPSMQVQSLTITIGGQSVTHEFGNMTFIADEYSYDFETSEAVSSASGAWGAAANASSTGLFTLRTSGYTVLEDIVLQGVRILETENTTVDHCEIIIYPESGGLYSISWDGTTPLELDAGSKVEISYILLEPLAQDMRIGTFQRSIVLLYSYNGSDYGTQPVLFLYTINPL